MIIGGLQKSTLIDYPKKVAATIFLSGCNFRCPFCHNPELVLPEVIAKQPKISEEEIFAFLQERKGFLDGIVICGGEPTVHSDLPEFLEKIKNIGFLIKLDSNGSNPKMLKEMIDNNLLDYVAMDIKSSKEKYAEVVGLPDIDISKIEESIEILKEGKIDYEFRTTLVPGLVDKAEVLKLVEWIAPAKKYFLQKFQNQGETVDPNFKQIEPYSEDYIKEIQKEIASNFEVCEVR